MIVLFNLLAIGAGLSIAALVVRYLTLRLVSPRRSRDL